MVATSWIVLAALVGPGVEGTGPSGASPPEVAPQSGPPFASLQEAHEAIAVVLRESNRAGGRDALQTTPNAVAVYRRLAASNALPSADLRHLKSRLRGRLLELRNVLQRRLVREERSRASRAGGGAGPAQELIEMIQTTIAPESWAVNGGKGTMMFYAPQNALVIRQTAEAHEQIGATLRQLRN